MKSIFFSIFLLFSVGLYSAEYTVKTIPNPKTTNAAAFVCNPDGILKEETVQAINKKLGELQATNTSEVAVVVVNSIGNEEIQPFATALFNEWGIGTAQNDNGLLVLFVMDQRKVTFETGYGLEGVLPDAITKRIKIQEMIPFFKQGDYDAGMLAGVERIASVVKGEIFEEKKETIPWNEILPLAIGIYIILILLAFVWVGYIVAKARKNSKLSTNIQRYITIKSESRALFIFLGFILPILATVVIIFLQFPTYYLFLVFPLTFIFIPAYVYSKIMMQKVRQQPIKCSECGGTMHILSEKQEDAHLKLAQQFEEQLQAVDYDVFVCDTCKNETIFTMDKPSAYTECPKCGTKAYILKNKQTLIAATYISTGTERVTYHCKFCGHEESHKESIPRLGAVVAGGGSSISSGSGGFSGGGFSGGSFGGGSSGGGGSTSSW